MEHERVYRSVSVVIFKGYKDLSEESKLKNNKEQW